MVRNGLRTLEDKTGPTHAEWRLLVPAAILLWVMIYAVLNFGLLTAHIEYQPERALRRVATCGAGFLLCLAMVPALHAVRSAPLPVRIRALLVSSLCAYLAHLVVRLVVFHVYRPLWGPLEPEVVLSAMQGSGLMFALWATFCLLLFAEERRAKPRSPEEHASSGEAQPIWSDEGRWRVKVPLDDVILCLAERDYVRLFTATRQYLVRGKLKDWAGTLPRERYLQVHRSAIVELAAVEAIRSSGSAWRVRLRNGIEAPVSRSMGKAVREVLSSRI